MIDISAGARIRLVRQGLGLTQKSFAESLGIGQGFLSRIEGGKKTFSDTLLIAMIQLYRIDKQWLLSGAGAAPEVGTLLPGGYTRTPAATTTPLLRRVAPGFPHQIATDDLLDHIRMPGNPPDCYALVAYGDFMAPTIQDNDLVLFRCGGEIKHGDIALMHSKWGDIFLRRYRFQEDGEWFSPDNSAYAPFQATHSRRIGVVTDVWRKVKL